MATTQIAVRIPEGLLKVVDSIVDEGVADSRADAVRLAVSFWVQTLEHRRDGKEIAAGYDRIPPGRPDDWGDLDAALDWGTAAVLSDLERQERDSGFEPW